MKIQTLRKRDFPSHAFFDYLRRGTEYYQDREFARALEEWSEGHRIGFTDKVPLVLMDGRIFCGSVLKEIPLLFLLYAIHINGTTGISVIKTEGTSKRLMFNNGLLAFAATTRKEERIGRFILQKKILSPESLEHLAKQAQQNGKRLGRQLVENKVLSPKALRELLTQQFEEILSDILFWNNGEFYFVERPVTEEAILGYTPLEAALAAAKKAFSFTYFKKSITNNKVVFTPSPYIKETKEAIIKTLNANTQFIFSLIDGVRNIDQIIRFCGGDEETVINSLYRLSSLGLVRKTKELGEYEDNEFNELSKALEVLFEVFEITANEFIHVTGARGKELTKKIREGLDPDYQKIFVNFPLDKPDKSGINEILKNVTYFFPSPDKRYLFIDAFQGLYEKILGEWRRYLGTGLTKKMVEGIKSIRVNIERFSMDSAIKKRMIDLLDGIIREYG